MAKYFRLFNYIQLCYWNKLKLREALESCRLKLLWLIFAHLYTRYFTWASLSILVTVFHQLLVAIHLINKSYCIVLQLEPCSQTEYTFKVPNITEAKEGKSDKSFLQIISLRCTAASVPKHMMQPLWLCIAFNKLEWHSEGPLSHLFYHRKIWGHLSGMIQVKQVCFYKNKSVSGKNFNSRHTETWLHLCIKWLFFPQMQMKHYLHARGMSFILSLFCQWLLIWKYWPHIML